MTDQPPPKPQQRSIEIENAEKSEQPPQDIARTTFPKERTDWFKRISDTVTLIVIIIGLYFAWDQAKQLNESIKLNTKAANLSVWGGLSGQTLDVDKVFLQYPEFQKYFYDGAGIAPDHADYQRARALGNLIIDYSESLLTFAWYSAEFEEPIMNPEMSKVYVRRLLKASPLLCRMYLETRDESGRALREIADAVCGAGTPAPAK